MVVNIFLYALFLENAGYGLAHKETVFGLCGKKSNGYFSGQQSSYIR